MEIIMKGRFSKTGIVLISCSLVCIILALAVGVPKGFFGDGGKGGNLDDEDTPKLGDIVDGKTPILMFDKSEDAMALMNAFDRGEIVDVELLYDQGGGNAAVRSSDQDIIRKAYKALKNIVIVEPADVSVTDSYHYVTFSLEGGGRVGYSFEGTDILCYDDGEGGNKDGNYSIEGSGGLWELYRQLTE